VSRRGNALSWPVIAPEDREQVAAELREARQVAVATVSIGPTALRAWAAANGVPWSCHDRGTGAIDAYIAARYEEAT
jgi:hypothetical protein